MSKMNKSALRCHLRTLYEGAAARNLQSGRICRHILNSRAYKEAVVIGGYMPMERESDILPVLRNALADGKTLALPCCSKAPHMTFRRVKRLEDLVPGRYGIMEPAADAPVIPLQDISLLLVPLEGIDRKGYRLGKGAGYYDAFLNGNNIMTIGCALSWQWVDSVPYDEWDQPLRAAADASGIQYFSNEMMSGKDAYYGKEEAED